MRDFPTITESASKVYPIIYDAPIVGLQKLHLMLDVAQKKKAIKVIASKLPSAEAKFIINLIPEMLSNKNVHVK